MILTLQVFFLIICGALIKNAILQRQRLLSWCAQHKIACIGLALFSSLYLVLSKHYFLQAGSRPVLDNYAYGLPFFQLMWESILGAGELAWWNPFVNGGEPLINLAGQVPWLHLPHLLIYSLAPFLNGAFGPTEAYFLTLILGNYFLASGIFFFLWNYFRTMLFLFLVLLLHYSQASP